MSSGANIWVNKDMSELISDFNGEYILITTTDMKKLSLGATLEEAIKKLKEIGRNDIAQQLR